eukprot:845989-Amorphochlora_amoeboformis.AAC.1
MRHMPQDQDIENFAKNCSLNKELQLPDIRYSLSKTPEELEGDLLKEQSSDVRNANLKKDPPEKSRKFPSFPVALLDP